MRPWLLTGVFASLLFFGVFTSSYAQELSDHVVINEVDTNPPGDDSKAISEWVELYNPTDETVDIGGWKVASTTILKKTLTIPAGTQIKAGQFLVYSYASLWFTDVSEKVRLQDNFGNVIDETPVITDQKNDFSSWQRNFDGVDSDASNDWVFRKSSVSSSNGKLDTVSAGPGDLTISVSTDKQSYDFGETATISGKVSKRIYQEKPYFSQQQIKIHIDGPGSYDKRITLYPDLNLEFKTSLKLDKVLGVGPGTYDVFVVYDVVQDKTVFSVGETAVTVITEEESELTISSDNVAYIPGQRVEILASTTEIIPLTGLEYGVFDPNGNRVFSGNLYPTTKGEFSTIVYMTTVNPVFGTFDIVANYGKQHAETTFELVKDVKDTEKIVLTTDKEAYGLGETVVISGRSNKFVAALDLEVLQSGATAIGKDTQNAFRIKNHVNLAGDSSFEYKLQIPNDNLRYGDYRVTVSKEFGQSIVYFKVVENPEEYSAGEKGAYVSTDKANYEYGEKLTIIGHVIPEARSTFVTTPVSVSIQDESGKPLTIVAKDKKLKIRDDSLIVAYSFTAIPDTAGYYKIDMPLNLSTFTPGAYIIEAKYGKSVTSTIFSVSGTLDTTDKNINAKLDKSIYGLGETVSLQGTLLSGQSAVKIILTTPAGKTVNSGAKVDNSKFSWSWTVPSKDYDLADIRDPREARPSVFGNYKLTISATSETIGLFFKVSKNPETDTLEIKPLAVATDKDVYKAGEKLTVLGNAIKRQQGTGLGSGVIPDRVGIQVKTLANKQIYDGMVSFDNAGNFKATYDLPLTIFKDGTYKVTATYQKLITDTRFEVRNDIPFGGDGKISITLNTDKEEYSPGDTVQIYGATNKILSLGKLDLVVIPEESKINCGTSNCGLGGKKIDLTRYYGNGLYKYDYKLPSSLDFGTYVIKVNAEFGTFSKTFKVIEKKEPQKTVSPLGKISDKFNRITDTMIDIPIFEQNVQDQDVVPWLIQGSVITTRGSEKSVNLKVMADDGSCVIGQDEGCLVSKSTKTSEGGYEVVSFAGLDYKVTYSGPEPFVENFSITPESEDGVIPNSIWTVEIIKENQSSRFYYEIIYKPIQ